MDLRYGLDTDRCVSRRTAWAIELRDGAVQASGLIGGGGLGQHSLSSGLAMLCVCFGKGESETGHRTNGGSGTEPLADGQLQPDQNRASPRGAVPQPVIITGLACLRHVGIGVNNQRSNAGTAEQDW